MPNFTVIIQIVTKLLAISDKQTRRRKSNFLERSDGRHTVGRRTGHKTLVITVWRSAFARLRPTRSSPIGIRMGIFDCIYKIREGDSFI